jgi:hypothetical protein
MFKLSSICAFLGDYDFNRSRVSLPASKAPHYSDSSGFSLALTSSSTVADALQIKRDPRFSQDTLRSWSA